MEKNSNIGGGFCDQTLNEDKTYILTPLTKPQQFLRALFQIIHL